MNADTGRSVIGAVVVACLALINCVICRAATLEECVYPPPAFGFPSPAVDAVVAGEPGSRVPLHTVHPALCAAADARACRGTFYLMPGDPVQAARRCGSWVYAKDTRKHHSRAGWIDLARLSAAPPDSVTTETAVDVTRLPMCTHHWQWATHEGRFAVSPGETINLHARNPMLCTDPDAGLCGSVRIIKPGPATYYSEPCGKWVYVSPRDRRSGDDATGWVDAASVVPMTPPVRPVKPPMPTDWRHPHNPLYEALVADDLTQVRQLIAAHADVDADKGAPLLAAIGRNNVEGAELLLAAGANPNRVSNPDAGPPLLLAMADYESHWDPTMILVLLKAGADPNYREPNHEYITSSGEVIEAETLLTLAARKGDLEVVRILLEDGANPLAARQDGLRPGAVAELNRHADVAALIEKYASEGIAREVAGRASGKVTGKVTGETAGGAATEAIQTATQTAAQASTETSAKTGPPLPP